MKYIKEFSEPSKINESLFCGYLWNTPTLYERYKNHKITNESFTEPIWYFYYRVGLDMYNSGIRTFDDVTVYAFLESRPKVKGKKSFIEVYDNYGGYDTISDIMQECNRDKNNDEYHLSEVQKYESLRNFQKKGLIDVTNEELVEKLTQMSLKQIQMFFQYHQKEAFSHVNSGQVVEHNLIDNLDETIEKLNAGESMGMPLHDSPRLNRKIKGVKLGTLMYLVLSSGVGKTSFMTEKLLLSLLENGEKGMIFANEEGIFKFRVLLLATVLSKILHKPIPRDTLNRGNFDADTMAKLNEAKEWLEQHRRDHILFFELKEYRLEDVLSRIQMYRALGYNHVAIDTFKPMISNADVARWEAFSNNAQELYNLIKEDNQNVATLATVQLKLGKEYSSLDLSSIGKSLEIVEVAGVVLIGRMLYSNEYSGQKNALKFYDWHKASDEEFELTGKKWVKKEFKTDPDKLYMVLFIAKNREGDVSEQILYEVNYAFNYWKEVCYCVVPKTSNVG